jgi:16S rRNA (cytosine1402-N4)-methyltransferase
MDLNITYRHKSVLVEEVIEYLKPVANGIYVDATFGGGGHTRAILSHEPNCTVIGLDVDRDAIDINGPLLQEEFPDKVKLLWGNFSQIKKLLKKAGITQLDGILADFGTSQFQIEHQEGFSFNVDSPLDMRMSPGHTKVTASEIVNKASAEELATIFFTYGEEHNSRKIARAIVSYRIEHGPIKTTSQLSKIVKSIIPPYSRSVHPATKVFQALRIVVNDELNSIKSLLTQSIDLLKPQGRIVCISFHSLEDRIVKQFFKQHQDSLNILTQKVVTATEQELDRNPSSRSAKLRAAEKI